MFRRACKSSASLLKLNFEALPSSDAFLESFGRWQVISGVATKDFATAAGSEGELAREISGRVSKLSGRKGKRAATKAAVSSRTQTRPINDEPSIRYNLEQSILQPKTRRTGLVAIKAGMTQEWDEWGKLVPLTVLWIDECQVVQVKTAEREGFNSLQLGLGSKRDKQLPGSLLGHFAAAGVPNKRRLVEFPVSADGLLPPGTAITASHFTAGQYVDVQGTTIGKGFQGVMKKWNFAGQPRSHGNSKAHRLAGSTGQCQDPGKVFPGKKMAGRMGGELRTVMNALVFKVDPVRNLLYVRGQVPGHKGNFVVVKDAALKKFDSQPQRPFPTSLEAVGLGAGITYAPKTDHSPFEPRER